MYTRCPSCRAEISFEPPANLETLPEGYKHRIKCPSCGVTIGVKINKIDTPQMPQPLPEQTAPNGFEPVYDNDEALTATPAQKPKHSGIGRNVTMMIMSLFFIAISVLGYFATKNNEDLLGVSVLDGVTPWNYIINNFSEFIEGFKGDGLIVSIINLLPTIVFTLAGINFIVALVSACGKKYGRAYNLISSLLIGVCSIGSMLVPVFTLGEGKNFVEMFLSIFNAENILNSLAVLVFAVLGLVQIILGLCFLKSLKRKEK